MSHGRMGEVSKNSQSSVTYFEGPLKSFQTMNISISKSFRLKVPTQVNVKQNDKSEPTFQEIAKPKKMVTKNLPKKCTTRETRTI